ncbi:hypothetical protein [Embleya hyalina]|uniref:Uncharacterized protein n=1 Tax=Embleya hyalina TaxID=516124 RepID=A0A401YXA5_9ACTN|nr:hypothetical protein [Embleya hyalina]GCD99211.1 hypothetical protein EHYA_06924 [Embleya hyalina]
MSAAKNPKRTAHRKPAIPVPYVSTWSGEIRDARDLQVDTLRISHLPPRPTDRDDHGVLWARYSSRPGRGRPDLGLVHPQRQRRAMELLLCQVTGKRGDVDEQRVLWLLEDHRGDWADWPNGLETTHPPMSRAGVEPSLQWCPHLRNGAVTVRVAASVVTGVYGTLWSIDPRTRTTSSTAKSLTFDSPHLPWMQARQLVRTLHGCTIVNDEP